MPREKAYCVKCRAELIVENDTSGKAVKVKCPKHGVIFKKKDYKISPFTMLGRGFYVEHMKGKYGDDFQSPYTDDLTERKG